MADIVPQTTQPVSPKPRPNYTGPQPVFTPETNKAFSTIADFFKGWSALPGAEDAAASAQTQAKKVAQELANKTGKTVSTPLNADEAAAQKDPPTTPTPTSSTPGSTSTSTPAPKPTNFQAPPTPNTNVPIDYNANPYYMRPTDTFQSYMARTQPGATPSATPTASSDGTMSTADQTALNSAISSSDPSDPSSVMSSALDFFGGGSQLDTAVKDMITKLTTPGNSFVDQYNQLIAQSGLTADQTQMVNLQNIMNGTEDDIRNEISNAGGFASESQIQAMVYQRNKQLEKQYSDLANIESLKANMVNTQIGLIEKDQTYQTTLFNTLAKLEEFGITKQTQFQNNTFNRLKWLATSGGLKNITPQAAALYSAGTGGQISADEIMQAAKNDTTMKDLQISIDQMRLSGVNVKSNVTGQTFATGLNAQVRRALTGFYGTGSNTRETIIATLTSEYPNLDPSTIQKAVYDQLPDGWENQIKGKTAQMLKSDETQNILSDIGSGATMSQLITAYPDVDPATLQSMYTANLTYGTASTGQ